MAAITGCYLASGVTRAGPAGLLQKAPTVRSVLAGKVRCSMEVKSRSDSKVGMGASLAVMATAAAMSSPAAMALVDERMSTEGTGLPFGLSSNLLGWILFGMFGLIWSLYFVYASGLDEDDDSGLSL
nr:PREDICTED: photosystem II reaction center W protein, chloroplastic-like isoform X3 [Daucus carota subsp. sativus]